MNTIRYSVVLLALSIFAFHFGGVAKAGGEAGAGIRARVVISSVQEKKAKLTKSLKAAIKLIKKLQRKFPELELSGLLDSLTASRGSVKRLKKLPRGIQKKVNGLVKKLKGALKSESPDTEELAELLDDIEEGISQGQTSSGESSFSLRLTPVAEDVFYTKEESVPSGVTKLPNLQGVPNAFTVTDLFFQNETILDDIIDTLTDTPSESECLAFRPTANDSRAAYEGCQGASAVFSPVSDVARAATDSCIATLAINPETLKNGISIKSGKLTELASLFKKAGTVAIELSTGETIFVTTKATKGKKLDVDVWSCGQNESTPKSLNTLTIEGDTYLLGFWGAEGDVITQGSLTFKLAEDEDSFIQPDGTVESSLVRSSPQSLQKTEYTFTSDGIVEAKNYSIINGIYHERRLTVGELFLLGFDRIRIGRYGSAYRYGEEAVRESGFDFGTTNYIVDNDNVSFLEGEEERALNSSFFTTPPLTPSNELTTHSCTPVSQLVLSLNMNAESVQDAIAPCTAAQALSDFCTEDENIGPGAILFHQECQ